MWGVDKWLHFAVSFLLAAVDPFFALTAGAGKEIWDAVSGGVADLADLAADALGVLAWWILAG